MSRSSPTAGVTALNKEALFVPGRFDMLWTGLATRVITGGLLMGGLVGPSFAQGIYTCIDAQGRRLTADRPIRECIDREQKELNTSGTVKRKLGPSLTAEERAVEEERARKADEERKRLAEEKKRERALLARYPDRAAHDKERHAALARADEAIATATKNTEVLIAARKQLEAELEFHGNDRAKAPSKLKRDFDDNDLHTEVQRRFIATHDAEKARINARFDEELARLKQLWTHRALPPAAAASAAKR
jgi:hypothetical protein